MEHTSKHSLSLTVITPIFLKVYKEACRQVGMDRAPTIRGIIYPPARDRRMERRNRAGEVFFFYLKQAVKGMEGDTLFWVRESWTFKQLKWDEFQYYFQLHLDKWRKTLARRGRELIGYIWVILPHKRKPLARCFLFLFYSGLELPPLFMPEWRGKPKTSHRRVTKILKKDALSGCEEWLKLEHLLTRNVKRYPGWMFPSKKKVIGHSRLPLWAKACLRGQWAQNIIETAFQHGDELIELRTSHQTPDSNPDLKSKPPLYKEPLLYTFVFKSGKTVSTLNPYHIRPISRHHLARVVKHYLTIAGKIKEEPLPKWLENVTSPEELIIKARKWSLNFEYFAERLAPQVIKFSNIMKKKKGEWVIPLQEAEVEDNTLVTTSSIDGFSYISFPRDPAPWETPIESET